MTIDTSLPDPHLWLEDIHGREALAWAEEHTDATKAWLASDGYEASVERLLEVYDSDDRIPLVHRRAGYYYNLWRDREHPRGLWRRTTRESYLSDAPEWDVLLDVDELGRVEGTAWVFAGARLLHPDADLALISLSPDGGDATTVREFDLTTRSFVPDGFVVPTAKGSVSWIDRDTIFVATDFGPGTMTESSYPRTVRRWRRGQPLGEAQLVREVLSTDMLVSAKHDHTPGFERDIVTEVVDFYRSRTLLLRGGDAVVIDLPLDVDIDIHREWLLVRTVTETELGEKRYPAGCLLAIELEAFLAGDRTMTVLFQPDEHTALEGWAWTRHALMLTLLQDVASRIRVLRPDDGWRSSELGGLPEFGAVTVLDTDPDESDEYWLHVAGFLTPPTVREGVLDGDTGDTVGHRLAKASASFFPEDSYDVGQHWAVSADGTRIPYFQIAPKGLTLDGSHPTVLSGYGGFEHARLPMYSGVVGRAWLERGGVYVVANIRGGGEYGPAWHRAALKENRHRAYEDFAAVATHLIERGVTTAERLGCEGRSNGGLLVGNMLTTYPELFGAIVCGVPLLDMQRYTRLSAGASWIAEYGDPDDPAEWEYIRGFSPYHNVRDDTAYPPSLFYAATSDDRVGPVQARKMVARMEEFGIPGVRYYENSDGGHGGSVDNRSTAELQAAIWEFFWRSLS
ncbi:prolyl oligopeptidase family serine peptidase [Planctomonas psychrotolerans]|uniref:prolyl oligopeptidase family serine peptidase n=1 Tax=Planctomonas psychrotolerans TaxID=2528712 RepID=UPI00123897C0|nr:prolyl oligopeptidase family serine peptidase [Planctomonas psychrotolerans]